MTIARLFKRLTETNITELDLDSILAILMENQLVPVDTIEEADQLRLALSLPTELLKKAEHMRFLELALLVPHEEAGHTEAVDWIAAGIAGGGSPRYSYVGKDITDYIVKHFNYFKTMPYYTAVTAANHLVDMEAERPNDLTPSMVAFLQRRERAHAQLMVTVTRLVGECDTVRQKLRKVEQESEMENLNRRYARANNATRVAIYPSDQPRPTHLFLIDPARLKEVEEFLTSSPDAQEGEEACPICMIAKGTMGCGLDRCKALYCATCFHKWFSKNEKCPHCQREFIPIAARDSHDQSNDEQ